MRVLDEPRETSALRSAKNRSAELANSVPRTCTRYPILNIAPPIDGARRPQKTFRPKTQQRQIGIRPEFFYKETVRALQYSFVKLFSPEDQNHVNS